MSEKFHTFTQLSAREDFIEFCHYDSFKPYNTYIVLFFYNTIYMEGLEFVFSCF